MEGDGTRKVKATAFPTHEHVSPGSRHSDFCDNRVITSKYTLLTFLPINLFEQFRRAANFYFLTMMIIAYIPDVAVIAPITSVLPLVFVIGVTAIKQAYEDYRRHCADAEINLRKTRILDENKEHHEVNYQDVRVGDIVKVLDGEEFPCDLVLLASSIPSHDCFITTANLDGEATLKVRYCPHILHDETWEDLNQGSLVIDCSPPDPHLYEFEGTIRRRRERDADTETESIGVKQLLLKGARLRNTEYIYGLAVYTGRDSKTALNQPKGRFKFSTVEQRLNHFLLFYFVFLLIMCTLSLLVHLSWKDRERSFWPLLAQDERTSPGENAKDWLSFMLLYNWVIPISLYVTMELQKLAGSFLIRWDVHMYDENQDEPAQARTSDLMEDVGQISYVFADKTGTLTENEMVFKECSIGGTRLRVRGYYGGLSLVPTQHGQGAGAHTGGTTDDPHSGTTAPPPMTADVRAEGSEAAASSARTTTSSSNTTLSSNYRENPVCDDIVLESPTAVHADPVPQFSRTSTERAIHGSIHTPASVHQASHMHEGSAASVNGTAVGTASLSKGADTVLECLQRERVKAFFECLAVCHTVTIEYEGVEMGAGETQRKRKLAAASPDEEALVTAVEMEQVGYKLEERTEKKIVLSYHGRSITYQILHVLEFDSKRKRMSVLVRDAESRVRLLLKGADSAVLPRTTAARGDATEEEKRTYEACQQSLDEYSRKGLRTLVVASRLLSEEEAADVLPKLQQANETLDNRKGKLGALYKELEDNLTLLGVTAVEDRLQDGVPETIVKIREAQMAMWVLTGDKVQTAINISLSAGHFTSDHPQLRAISISNPKKCRRVLLDFYRRVESMLDGGAEHGPLTALRQSSYGTMADTPPSHRPQRHRRGDGRSGMETALVALIVDDVTLAVALKHHSRLFRALSMRCRAVLCCRLSPAQKAAVVRLVKTGSVDLTDEMSVGIAISLSASRSTDTDTNGSGSGANGGGQGSSGGGGGGGGDNEAVAGDAEFRPPGGARPITLAIGDGANDVAMIREAHIGVGITGKEGRQAARTSDYSLARFRFLARLLLVHGHYSYWRMAYTVQYFFYKNLIYILPFIYFGPQCLFSAQTLYPQWLLTFWSVFFTSLPILCFGIFEKDASDALLMANPKTYSIFAGNRYLSWGNFFFWTLTAIWHGSVAYFGMTIFLSIMRPVLSLWWLGNAMYLLLLITVTLKISSDTRNWTWITHVCYWGSLAVFFAFVLYTQGVPLALGSGTTPGVFWSALNLWETDYFWATLVVLLFIAMLPDWAIGFVRRVFFPDHVQRLQAQQWSSTSDGPYVCVNSCLQTTQARQGRWAEISTVDSGIRSDP